jgi:hypothetical protein
MEEAMHMKISDNQFTLEGERLTHEPTGAVFWLGHNDVVLCESGSANHKIGDEHDYSLQELKGGCLEYLQIGSQAVHLNAFRWYCHMLTCPGPDVLGRVTRVLCRAGEKG